jgi:conjugal transfer pilus assembly protein TrbC
VPARTEPRTFAAAACAVGLLAAALVHAQTPRWPDAADIERARKAHPFPGASRLGEQPAAPPPRVQRPATAGTIDIEALARAGGRLRGAVAVSNVPAPLRIFITLEMPRASLQLLTDQAARSGAVLVLRGLKANSMRETLATVSGLMGEREVAWTIDPEAFTRYGVERAPTFVLSLGGPAEPERGCGSDCRVPTPFVSVSGDVSLEYALQALARQRPDAAPRVAPLLQRLRDR